MQLSRPVAAGPALLRFLLELGTQAAMTLTRRERSGPRCGAFVGVDAPVCFRLSTEDDVEATSVSRREREGRAALVSASECERSRVGGGEGKRVARGSV